MRVRNHPKDHQTNQISSIAGLGVNLTIIPPLPKGEGRGGGSVKHRRPIQDFFLILKFEVFTFPSSTG